MPTGSRSEANRTTAAEIGDAQIAICEATTAMDTIYKNPDADPKGPWTSDNPCANHGDGSGGMCYAKYPDARGKGHEYGN